MYRTIVVAALVLGCGSGSYTVGVQEAQPWHKTVSIKTLPFAAFVLRVVLQDSDKLRVVHVLMDPEDVTESNLGLLFHYLSNRYMDPVALEVWVNTDVEQLGDLATNRSGSDALGEEARIVPDGAGRRAKKRVHQLALYKRNKDVELFRYNPSYPEPGEKTVILRGKE